MHVNDNFNTSFAFDFYVCLCCTFSIFGAIFGYLFLSPAILIGINKEILKNAFANSKRKSQEIKKNVESYRKPTSSIALDLPVKNDITVLLKTGIPYYYNNYYMSVTIYSILGNIIAKYIPFSSNISSPVLKAVYKYRKKFACQVVRTI